MKQSQKCLNLFSLANIYRKQKNDGSFVVICFYIQVLVDMFLTTIMRTDYGNDYRFHFLKPCRDSGSTCQGQYPAHLLIWSFPLYRYGMPAPLKALLDRTPPLSSIAMQKVGGRYEQCRSGGLFLFALSDNLWRPRQQAQLRNGRGAIQPLFSG